MLSADCIEFCPHEGFHDLFICGTYQVLAPESSKSPNETAITAQETNESGDDDIDDDVEEGPPKPTQRTGRLVLFRIGEDRSSV